MSDRPWNDEEDIIRQTPEPVSSSRYTPFQQEFLRYLGISVLIFIVGCVGGVLSSQADPAFGESLVKLFKEMITNDIMSDAPPLLALQLFLNNLESCVLLFLGGAILGVVTLLVLSFNGIVIGGILEVVRGKTDIVVMFASIVPHGIFELPAVLVSSTLGLMLGRAVMLELAGQGDASAQAYVLGRLFIRYVVPFIAIAACIEAFITPAVLGMVA
ncbi:stage II sporulation protein M [Methanospirillum lacunae]|uniref:Stage II sporulation protein M n=1 Tax=Methanospirillum lacunae TaxID=668570 RepID=A0A2V2N5S9_9EURY|nr:stage II sporulation protein M [Methanospirillum lacunae]PWR71577.1 stage II sporulation protein M [Methanospirillum lacunae]